MGGDGFGAAAEPGPLTTRSPIFYQHERSRVCVINQIHSLMRSSFLNTLGCGDCPSRTRILTSVTSISSTLRPFNLGERFKPKPTTVSQRQTNSKVNGCGVAFATLQVKSIVFWYSLHALKIVKSLQQATHRCKAIVASA